MCGEASHCYGLDVEELERVGLGDGLSRVVLQRFFRCADEILQSCECRVNLLLDSSRCWEEEKREARAKLEFARARRRRPIAKKVLLVTLRSSHDIRWLADTLPPWLWNLFHVGAHS